MTSSVQQSTDAAAIYAALNAKENAAGKKSVAEQSQDRFLKLLVTQMQNQDPLNPMDNAQVTSQMAQLSTVTGIDKLNSTLQVLSESLMGNQSLQAAGMIGRGIFLEGDGVQLSAGKAMGGIELSQSVEKLGISIYDRAGNLVDTLDMGPQKAGIQHWAWDGKNSKGETMPDGAYTFKVNAESAGKSVPANTLQFGVVNSVTQGKQGVTVGTPDLEGVALSKVKQII